MIFTYFLKVFSQKGLNPFNNKDPSKIISLVIAKKMPPFPLTTVNEHKKPLNTFVFSGFLTYSANDSVAKAK